MIKRRTQSGMTRDYHCPFKWRAMWKKINSHQRARQIAQESTWRVIIFLLCVWGQGGTRCAWAAGLSVCVDEKCNLRAFNILERHLWIDALHVIKIASSFFIFVPQTTYRSLAPCHALFVCSAGDIRVQCWDEQRTLLSQNDGERKSIYKNDGPRFELLCENWLRYRA